LARLTVELSAQAATETCQCAFLPTHGQHNSSYSYFVTSSYILFAVRALGQFTRASTAFTSVLFCSDFSASSASDSASEQQMLTLEQTALHSGYSLE
jgi:hypothetical protein